MVSARQILTGEVPVTSLHTRYLALACGDGLPPRREPGDIGMLFTVVEMLETMGWEVVSITRDMALTYAYMRHVTRPPSQPAPPPPYAAG